MKPLSFGISETAYKKTASGYDNYGIPQVGTAAEFYCKYVKSRAMTLNENNEQVKTNYEIGTEASGFDYGDQVSLDGTNYYQIQRIDEKKDLDGKLRITIIYI